MKVNYAGTVSLSTVDWRGRAAITIFFRGCPLRCPYCQNHPHLHGSNPVELDFVKEQIRKSKPFVSAVVFSGGEPLMHDAIVPLAEFAREMKLTIGIHTNGCYPEMVSKLVNLKLVDKIFIDIKAPPEDTELYGKVTGCVESEAVKETPEQITTSVIKTLEIVDSCGLKLELRTTLIRDFIGSPQEIANIAAWISGHIKNKEVTYVLQQGIPEYSLQENLRNMRALERGELYELGRIARRFIENVRIRTRENGEEIISDSV